MRRMFFFGPRKENPGNARMDRTELSSPQTSAAVRLHGIMTFRVAVTVNVIALCTPESAGQPYHVLAGLR